MGRHEHALELYVYKVKDYTKAEECVFPPLQSQSLVDPVVDTASEYIIQTQSPEASS